MDEFDSYGIIPENKVFRVPIRQACHFRTYGTMRIAFTRVRYFHKEFLFYKLFISNSIILKKYLYNYEYGIILTRVYYIINIAFTRSRGEGKMDHSKDFNELAKQKYNELESQETELKMKLEEIQKQKNPLKVYLQGAGLIEVKRRGRRRKKAELPQ